MLMVAGGIDLSVGGNLALCGSSACRCRTTVPIPIAFAAATALGAAVALSTGFSSPWLASIR
jgi:ribose/xylose/arabinose/galactoside ABC-type transport system permease subunit